MDSAMGTEQSDCDLLKAFIEHGDAKATGRDEQRAELVRRLREHIVWHVAQEWPDQAARYDDLEADAFVLLMGWRSDERLFAKEPLWRLAWRLVQQISKAGYRQVGYAKRLEETEPPEAPSAPTDPEESASRRELLVRLQGLMVLLSEQHHRAIVAQVAAEQGHGPPLEEALGCEPAAARKRLERARLALARLALEHGLSESLSESGISISGGSE
jgi:DNA-directed RNA polymerase specialized sigma24 family protein